MPASDPPRGSGQFRLRREPRRVIVRLMDGAQVDGFIHVPPTDRPLDFLNQQDQDFIAMTDVRLTEPDDSVKDLPFLAVSKGQIARLYEAK